MILQTDTLMIDIDKVSFVNEDNGTIVVDGQGVMLTRKEDYEAVRGAVKWLHRTHIYDMNLKKIKKEGE